RAVGASRRQVLGALLAEAVAMGVVASLLGLAAGVLLALGLLALLEGVGLELPDTATIVSVATVVTALVVGVGVTVFSAMFPAWKGASVPPLAAMRDVAVEDKGWSRARLAVGLLTTLAGVVLVLTGLFGGNVPQI